MKRFRRIKFILVLYYCMINCCHGAKNKTVKKFGIVGGQETTIHKFPYQGAFIYGDKLKCGVSIISEDCFLTAAHCTYQFSKNVVIRVGSTAKDSGGTVYEIDEIINHPNFESVRLINDFAIMKPTKPIEFDGINVRPVPLPKLNQGLADGTICEVSGWGKADNDTRPEKLRWVKVEVVNRKVCQNCYNTPKVRFKITEEMFCAGYMEGVRDACSGDSGGPLVCNGVQFGIVSSGYGCGYKNFPGIYSNISKVINWIEEYCEI